MSQETERLIELLGAAQRTNDDRISLALLRAAKLKGRPS